MNNSINISTIESDTKHAEITGTKSFSCELCKNVYSSIFSLSNHKRLYHSNKHDDRRCRNKQDNLYYCRFCENKYKHCSTRSKHEKMCKSNKLDSINN